MTRTEMKLATIAGVVAWLRKHRFHDDADSLKAARQNFDHLPASIIVAACMIAADDSDAEFWNDMESDMLDAALVSPAMDTAFKKEIDLDAFPF
jgi:hypothetical protein